MVLYEDDFVSSKLNLWIKMCLIKLTKMLQELLQFYSFWSKIFGNVLLQKIFNRAAGNLRGMKDVFKELKVLDRKVALHIINKNILETIFTSTSTILVTY